MTKPLRKNSAVAALPSKSCTSLATVEMRQIISNQVPSADGQAAEITAIPWRQNVLSLFLQHTQPGAPLVVHIKQKVLHIFDTQHWQ